MRVERERERKSRDSPRAETEPNFRRKCCAVRAREKEMLLLQARQRSNSSEKINCKKTIAWWPVNAREKVARKSPEKNRIGNGGLSAIRAV